MSEPRPKPDGLYWVYRTMKGTQVTQVRARSRADAVRKVIDGHGEPVSFEITDAARTGQAIPMDNDGVIE